MRQVPERLWVTAGADEGETELNAFDNALLRAQTANYNLIRVSSIVPKGARLVEEAPSLPEGALLPVVLAKAVSRVPGELISSCVGIGLSKDSFGMIMEHAGAGPAALAEEKVRRMLAEAFARRGLALDRVLVKSCEHRVQNAGCTVAAVVLW